MHGKRAPTANSRQRPMQFPKRQTHTSRKSFVRLSKSIWTYTSSAFGSNRVWIERMNRKLSKPKRNLSPSMQRVWIEMLRCGRTFPACQSPFMRRVCMEIGFIQPGRSNWTDFLRRNHRPTMPNGNHNRGTFFLAPESALRNFRPDKRIL